jgi:adenylate kinase family enzyme
MRRVAVIGNAGGGKSTLSRAISAYCGLPLYAVDRFQWRPGWQAVPEAEVGATLDALLGQESWLIDGWGPWTTLERRFAAADTIVLVDHPLWIHFWWAAERQIACAQGNGQPNGPEGCDMLTVTPRVFKMIWDIDREQMPRLRKLVASMENGRRVERITSPRALGAFVARYSSPAPEIPALLQSS